MIVSHTKTPFDLSATGLMELARFCVDLCEHGKKVICDYKGNRQVREKSPRDFVTAVDEAVQKAIWTEILSVFPASRLLGEEGGSESNDQKIVKTGEVDPKKLFSFQEASHKPERIDKDAELVWIIDPIDGTANFVHNIPYYAISIAVAIDGRVIAGAVLDICHDRCFWASEGGPAMVNETLIKPSTCTDMSYAMLAISLPCEPKGKQIAFHKAQEIAQSCANIRRLGSAALNICNVANGSLDGYWAACLNIWDVAAAALILKQSGGFQSLLDHPGDWKLGFLCTNNDTLGHELKPIVA